LPFKYNLQRYNTVDISTSIAKLPGGDASGAIARYDDAYQRRLNPYTQFQASESEVGLYKLNPVDT
jgi:hypothetical protein